MTSIGIGNASSFAARAVWSSAAAIAPRLKATIGQSWAVSVCTVEGDVTSDDPYPWTEADHGPFEFGAAVALVKGCSPERALDVLGARRATQVPPRGQCG